MSDDITRAIDWVGCTTNSPAHTEEIRSDALKALAALRVDLAVERERADAHYRVLERVSAKRDTLRALLKEALAHLKTGQWDVPTDIALMARIDAALNKGGE